MAAIVLLGMDGAFSRVALETLLAAGIEVRALVVPGLRSRLRPVPRRQVHVSAPSAAHLAQSLGLPVIEMASPRDPAAPGLVREHGPSALAVACFPWLLPRAWLDLAPRGALNIHPSLLPAYRGPVPLFWQLRAGEERTGVTVHRLDEGADTGDILAQAEVPFADGSSWDALETRLAEAGARLLAETLRADPPGRPQPAEGASQQGLARSRDLELPTSWTARRAFNFMRGASGFGPFRIVGGGESIAAREALSFSATGGETGRVRALAGGVEIAFSPGTLVVARA